MLLPYQDETVRGVLLDIAALSEVYDSTLKPDSDQAGGGGAGDDAVTRRVQLALFESQRRRQKRCLLVYMTARCERIEALRWNTGPVIPAGPLDALSNSEKDYFRAYDQAVTAYAAAVGIDVLSVRCAAFAHASDAPAMIISKLSHPRSRPTPRPLALQCLRPPRRESIPVRVLRDCGVVLTSDGPRRLCQGEVHFMLRSDCEPLIRQGLMEQLPSD
jgi:GINS complex subunit 1